MAGLTLELKGVPEALAALNQFSNSVRRKHTRISINKGLGILKTEAQKRMPEQTGLSKKWVAVKAGTKKDGSEQVYGRVGVKRGFRHSSFTAKGKLKFVSENAAKKASVAGKQTSIRRPSRYIHLVHGGTKSHSITTKSKKALASREAIFGRRVTVKAKANPFLAQTVAAQGTAAVNVIAGKLREGVEIERARALARSRVR